MHREKYWSSKVPLPLALLFVLNVLLIFAAEVLFLYTFPAQPGAEDLAKYDPVYKGSRVLISDERSYLGASLVEASDGQTHLVVTRYHSIAYNRCRILYAEPVEIPASGEQTVSVKNGIHTSEIGIGNTVADYPFVAIRYSNTGTIREQSVIYMLLAAVLEALELAVFYLIQKNLMS